MRKTRRRLPQARRTRRRRSRISTRTCAACHGENAGGGDRAPALTDNAHLRTLDIAGIEAIIKGGQRGMPPFPNLPQAEVTGLAAWIHSMNISALQSAPPEQVHAGEAYFLWRGRMFRLPYGARPRRAAGPGPFRNCGPFDARRNGKVAGRSDLMMGTKSLPSCPGWAFCPDFQWAIQDVVLKNGEKLRGFGRRRTEHEVALQTSRREISHALYARDRQHYAGENLLDAGVPWRRQLIGRIFSPI